MFTPKKFQAGTSALAAIAASIGLLFTSPFSHAGTEATNVRVDCQKGGAVVVSFQGDAKSYLVEMSDDLSEWKPMGEVKPGGGGGFNYYDESGARSRYYRLVPVGEGGPDPANAAIVSGLVAQRAALAVEQIAATAMRAALQREKERLEDLVDDAFERAAEAYDFASVGVTSWQEDSGLTVVWFDGEMSEFEDPAEAEEFMGEIREEQQQAERDAESAIEDADAYLEDLKKICEELEELDGLSGRLEALKKAADAAAKAGDPAIDKDPCAKRDALAIELGFYESLLAELNGEKRALKRKIAKKKAAADKARADANCPYAWSQVAWNLYVYVDRSGVSPLTTRDEVEKKVQEKLAKRRQAEQDARAADAAATALETELESVCKAIIDLEKLIAEVRKELEEAENACERANASADPVQRAFEALTELVLLEMERDQVAQDKEYLERTIKDLEEAANGYEKMAMDAIGVDAERFWIMFAGGVLKFDEMGKALRFLEEANRMAGEFAQRAADLRADAAELKKELKKLCDELDAIDSEIADLEDALDDLMDAIEEELRRLEAAEMRDLIAALIALIETERDAIENRKNALLREAAAHEEKATAERDGTPLGMNFIEPRDGHPYFLVRRLDGTVCRIPVEFGENGDFEEAVLNARHQAEEKLEAEVAKREAANAAEVAAAAAAATAAANAHEKAEKLCEKLRELDEELLDWYELFFEAAEAAQPPAPKPDPCAERDAKLLEVGQLMLEHLANALAKAGARAKATQAQRDADEAKKKACAGLSMVINHTESRSVAAYGDEKHYFDGPGAAAKARAKHKELKAKRKKAKEDAKAKQKPADDAKAELKKACEAFDASKAKLEACLKELARLQALCDKKNNP